MHIKAILFEVLFVFPFGVLLQSVLLSVSATDWDIKAVCVRNPDPVTRYLCRWVVWFHLLAATQQGEHVNVSREREITDWWSLIQCYSLLSWADSLHAHVVLHEWLAFYSVLSEYPPKWCNYSASMAGATWNCSHLGASSVDTIQPCTMSLHAKPHT